MAPTPPSVDVPLSGPASASDDRIRRNVACINCRNSKVRCKTSAVPGQPCQRCSKLSISCVVDKSHKRVTKRSKLEQLEEELKSIKQVVNPRASGENSWSPASPHVNSSSFAEQRSRPGPPQIPTPRSDHPPLQPKQGSERPPKTRPTESRQFGPHVVVGSDVDWLFNRFLQCHHPLLPVLRKKDPDECYEAHPTLFWVIMYIACRGCQAYELLFTALPEFVEKEVWASVSAPVLTLEAIHAILLLCSWPVPKIRFATDPSTTLSNIALNACVLQGLHTGKGRHTQYCVGLRREIKITDEEASCTWIACCAIANRAASMCGHPPPSIQLNDSHCKRGLESPDWGDLITFFNVQKFCNRLHTSMNAQLSSEGTVPYAIVSNWEDELETLKPLLVHQSDDYALDPWDGRSRKVNRTDPELARFLLLSAQLEVQTYYFCVPRTVSQTDARYSTLKAFNTARSILTAADELDTRSSFLSYAPHWAVRTIVDAACATIAILHSTFAPDMTAEDAGLLGQHAVTTVQRCSVCDSDLAYRGGVMFETFWAVRHLLPRFEGAPCAWSARVGAGLTFWCMMKFREGLQDARNHSETAKRGLDILRIPNLRPDPSSSTAPQQDQVSSAVGLDPFQDVDWSMFMDDFGWASADAVFMGLPT